MQEQHHECSSSSTTTVAEVLQPPSSDVAMQQRPASVLQQQHNATSERSSKVDNFMAKDTFRARLLESYYISLDLVGIERPCMGGLVPR